MAHRVAKVAVSLPKEVFRSVEQERRKLKMGRSEAVVEALRAWLKQHEEQELVRQYIEGYRKYPEHLSPEEAKARLKLAAQAFHPDERW